MTFPVDLLTEIFVCLPAKTLLRFKVVCKLWYHLITNVNFVNLHLQRSLATKTNLHLLVATPMLHFTDFDTFANTRELDYPFKEPPLRCGVYVIGTVNGLVCLCGGNDQIIIYNPTTQTNRFLPPLPIEEKLPAPRGVECFNFALGFDTVSLGFECFKFGFGFDTVSQDYKCVWIREFYPVWQVMVYSLNNHSWKRIPDTDFFYSCYSDNVLLHETIYWLSYDTPCMVAFSLQDENFSTLKLPEYQVEDDFTRKVAVLDGHLCLLISHSDGSDVWIMEEYGVFESWKKVFKIGHKYGEIVVRILSYSSNGKGLFALLRQFPDPQLAYLDLETMQVTDVQVADFDACGDAHLCVENLLMLDHDANYVHVEEEEHGQEHG